MEGRACELGPTGCRKILNRPPDVTAKLVANPTDGAAGFAAIYTAGALAGVEAPAHAAECMAAADHGARTGK
jgi:hypothetical protein